MSDSVPENESVPLLPDQAGTKEGNVESPHAEIPQETKSLAEAEYEITVKTSDIEDAETLGKVLITLHGTDVSTTQTPLCPDEKKRKLCFRRGGRDTFKLRMEDVGTIKKVHICYDVHDVPGWDSGWHLELVTIKKMTKDGQEEETLIFPCHKWLCPAGTNLVTNPVSGAVAEPKLSTDERRKYITSHRKLMKEIQAKRQHLNTLQAILQELCDLYTLSQADRGCCCRHSDQMLMAEEAVKAYRKLTETDDMSHDEARSLLEHEDLEQGIPYAAIYFLLRRTSATQHVPAKMYLKMKDQVLYQEVNEFRQETKELTLALINETNKLERLDTGLSEAKKTCCLWRYRKIEAIIEEVTRDSLVDD